MGLPEELARLSTEVPDFALRSRPKDDGKVSKLRCSHVKGIAEISLALHIARSSAVCSVERQDSRARGRG